MGWTDLIGLVLILVVLVGIFRVMLRPDRPSTHEVKAPRLRAFFSTTFFAGLLSAVAVGALVHDTTRSQGDRWLVGLMCGAAVAVLFGLLSFGGKWNEDGLFTGLLSALFGAIGLIVTVSSFFAPQGVCTPADIGQRVLGFLLVAVALVLGGALAWTRNLFALKYLGSALLAVFGTLQVLDLIVFLSNPFGVSLAGLGVSGWAIALVAAFALGFAVSIWPDLVLTVTAIGVAAGAVYLAFTGTGSSSCVPGVADPTALGPLVGYVMVYLGMRLALGRVLNMKKNQESNGG